MINFSIGTESEKAESSMRNRVSRWAAGYNVVRVRQSDHRFLFSQYPDSKNLSMKYNFRQKKNEKIFTKYSFAIFLFLYLFYRTSLENEFVIFFCF